MSKREIPEIPAGFPDSSLLILWCETPLHPGVGTVVKGGIDLPIQREKLTGLPMIQASGIKGALRKAAESALRQNEIKALFGPEPKAASEHAGSLLLTDAQLLLFPVSSVMGMMCWVTSPTALARFGYSLNYVNGEINIADYVDVEWGESILTRDTELKVEVAGKSKIVLLDEYEFDVDERRDASSLVEELKDRIVPTDPSYEYIKRVLPRRFAIVADDAFKELTSRGTEVLTRVRLTDAKTVEAGGLWSEEHLTAFTVLYCSAFMPGKFRAEGLASKPKDVLNKMMGKIKRIVLGGHETVGRGVVRILKVDR